MHKAEDPMVRNTTNVRVLKNRFSGMTGASHCADVQQGHRQTDEMTEGRGRTCYERKEVSHLVGYVYLCDGALYARNTSHVHFL